MNRFPIVLKKKNKDEIIIENEMPLPIKGVDYQEQLRILYAMKSLSLKSSFLVREQLRYAVRKMANDYLPEYKISIRKIGESYRVYRVR